MKILDCTLRDGGYYTDWDYPQSLIDTYFDCIKNLPIDVIEIGYIGHPKTINDYRGKFYYLSPLDTKKIKIKVKNKKIAIMIDTKDWTNLNELKKTLAKYSGIVDVIRFAVDWKNITKQKKMIKCAGNLNFQVCTNLMYCHEFLKNKKLKSIISNIIEHSDVIYFVDSFGALLPGELSQIIKEFKQHYPTKKFGFHGHNNLELALSNSIEAIKNNAYLVDSTITGMGRGAGNLKTELLLSYLKNLNTDKNVNFDILDKIVKKFENLKKNYNWGTNLPYMLSGSNKIPQSNVTKFVNSNRLDYKDLLSFNKKKINLANNNSFKTYKHKIPKIKNVLLVGGGDTIKQFDRYLISLLNKNKNLNIIFASPKNLDNILKYKIKNKIFLCLGYSDYNKNKSEIKKYKKIIYLMDKNVFMSLEKEKLKKYCLLKINNQISYYKKNSPLFIAFESLKQMKTKNVFMIGFDGYKNQKIDIYSKFLNEENQEIIDFFKKKINLYSLTPTIYKGLNSYSLFKELLKNKNSLNSL